MHLQFFDELRELQRAVKTSFLTLDGVIELQFKIVCVLLRDNTTEPPETSVLSFRAPWPLSGTSYWSPLFTRWEKLS